MREHHIMRMAIMSEEMRYRELKVWQKGMDLVEDVYHLTAGFPRTEAFGMTTQLRRAACSIPMKLAEGSCRGTRRDYANFVATATGSAGELDTGLLLAVRLGLAKEESVAPALRRVAEVGRMLRVLRTRLLGPPRGGSSSLIPLPSSP
jgi:four helix bundle protein